MWCQVQLKSVNQISFFFLLLPPSPFLPSPLFPSSSITSPPSQGIFDILAEMNPKPKALVLDWSYHVTQLFNCFAKLLAHPLQRPVQTQMDGKLSPLS